MPNTTKSNRLKRKRGKKFVFHENKTEDKKEEQNPFEEHSKTRKFTKDLEKRQQLLEEYRNLGKNSQLIDNRIGEKSSKLSEDDKMKLRYIAEQRDRARSHLNKKTSRKKEKFNLDSDESEGGDVFIGGFTHKGRPVEDDFDDRISLSSDGETGDKGKLTEEMVNQLNFGKGNEEGEEKKKSRKEIFEEIIEKSKAYKEANKELKFINRELVQELDDDYNNLLGLLDFNKNNKLKESSDPKIRAADEKGKGFDIVQNMLKFDNKKVAPVATSALTEHDQAQLKKRKIQEALNTEANSGEPVRKRDQKLVDKREIAMDRAIKQQNDLVKDMNKSELAEKNLAVNIKKVKFDDDLQSEEESGEYYDEDGESEDSSD